MLKSLLKDSFIYGASKYLSVFASIFLMPIYTRLLTPEDYGIMEIVNSWNTFVIVILPLGLSSSILRFQTDMNKDLNIRKKYLGTIFLTYLTLGGIYTILMLLFSAHLIPILGTNPAATEIFYYSIFIVIGNIFIDYYLKILQAGEKKYHYLAISITSLSILIVLGFTLVYYYKQGIVGFFRASSISISCALILAIALTRSDFSIRFSRKFLHDLLKYSIHILSVGLLFNAVNLIDRYIILKYGDLADVGIYSIGVRISSIMGLTVTSFGLAWFPKAMNIKDNENAHQIYGRVHNFYFVVGAILLFAILLSRKEIIEIFAPGYQDATQIIGYLATYLIINGAIYFYSLGIHITKKTKYFTISAVLSIVINLLTSILLIQQIGINGVAIGTLIGGVVWVGVQKYFSQKEKFIPYNFRYVLYFLILTIIAFLFTNQIDEFLQFSLIQRIIIKGLFIASIGTIFLYLILGSKNIKSIIRLLTNNRSN